MASASVSDESSRDTRKKGQGSVQSGGRCIPTAGAGVGRGPKKRGNPVIDSLHGRHSVGTVSTSMCPPTEIAKQQHLHTALHCTTDQGHSFTAP